VDYTTIKNTVLWVIVAVIVVAVVLAVIIKKIIGKIITLVIAAALVFFGWQQRAKIIDYANGVGDKATSTYCSAEPSFFGVHVTFPGC
jgi:hypothetical protein